MATDQKPAQTLAEYIAHMPAGPVDCERLQLAMSLLALPLGRMDHRRLW